MAVKRLSSASVPAVGNRLAGFSIGYVMAITLFGYSLLAFLVTDPSSSRLITVPYRFFVLACNAGFLLLLMLRQSKSRSAKVNYAVQPQTTATSSRFYSIWVKLLLTFTLMYSIRVLCEIFIIQPSLWKPPSEYLLFWFLISLLPATSFLFLRDQELNKFAFGSWLILFISSLFGIRLALAGAAESLSTGRLTAAAINPISLGHVGASLFLVSLFLWLKGSRIAFLDRAGKSKLTDMLLLFSAGLGLILCLLAASRGPILSVSCCFLILVAANRNSFKAVVILVLVCIGATAALSFATSQGSSIVDRFANPFIDYTDAYNSDFVSRGDLGNAALAAFMEHPFLGSSLELSDNLGYPHNVILEAFMSTGLFGGMIFAACYIYGMVKSMYLIVCSRSAWQWLGLLYIQYGIGVLSSGSLYGSNVFWYLLFAVIGLRRFKFKKKLAIKAT
ncbi:O-antigen ligase family protein [filamentous cyanobacterium LEGE 11480]|uniref:O-antigen ligase family protein n=1 Tax=Romeriopsis navalis LEGE 11480 TaxID=2777977 RepID=A0A928VMX3_9CYAN|nr:O-antigen ligase family protein [Romeriopsis navalis]MBE9028904.1 O-antigen ligase family protein [Romeriopsis navalis LEGE 11480]